MKIAHIADTHLSERAKHHTLDEQEDLLIAIGDDARARGAKCIVHAGDFYDGLSTPREREAACRILRLWSEHIPVVIVRGNHDRPQDIAIFESIKSGTRINVREHPGVVRVGDTAIGCLPWPRKEILQSIPTDRKPDSESSALKCIVMQYNQWFNGFAGPRILLTHCELGSALMDSGQPIAAHADIKFTEQDLLDTGADYIAAGHIHKHQIIDGKICYAGGVRQCTFGETGPKGYCLVDVERGRGPVIKHVEIPSRKLITLDDSALCFDVPKVIKDAAYRIVYEIDESDKQHATIAANRVRDGLLDAGAHSVKLEPRIKPNQRVRSEEIKKARTTIDRLEAYWQTTSKPERATGILEKLNQLEAQSR